MAKILIADDEQSICLAFTQFLKLEKHTALSASSAGEALDLVQREQPDVVFLDVLLGTANGLDVLAELRRSHPQLPVIVMTAYGGLDTAMQAMKLGAFDYLGKPLELADLRSLLRRALQARESVRPEETSLPFAPTAEGDVLIGQCAAMQHIFKLMSLLTTNDLTVLIRGENGVGKELVAKGIHSNSSRKNQPFLAVNCAAIPENHLESEFFGHERGAFNGAETRRIGRFEAAEGGTLFLDEISELPFTMQSKLLRVLQERSFERVGSYSPLPLKARLIVATHCDLEVEVKAGRFREDLYCCLKLATLDIPPLRDRKEDIPLLARYFLSRINRDLGKSIEGLEPAVLAALEQYDWPGNIRELEHTLNRAVLIAKGPRLSQDDLDFALQQKTPEFAGEEHPLAALRRAVPAALHHFLQEDDKQGAFDAIISIVEQEVIEEALKICDGNQVAASKLLRLNRTTLRKKQKPA